MAESSNSRANAENELTMCDVLEEEQELEDDANAVLGGSDDTNCSYDKGYVPRQALYACTTCSTNQEPSGVCLACSYKCHDGHEIVELYTKRNFRCDCGNSKFADKKCSLKPDKDPVNKMNKYNQNFKGLYCNCSRPYPDLEDNIQDEMIQCVICEDWYHGRHIGGEAPEDYSEMICSKCMESHKFLYHYLNKYHYVNVTSDNCKESDKCNGAVKTEADEGLQTVVKKEADSTDTKEKSLGSTVASNESASDLTTNQNVIKSEEEYKVKSENCFLLQHSVKPDGIKSGAAFWPENWRKELCHCSSCMDMYTNYDCTYLLNLEDTILAYEERGKSANESQYDRGLTALSQLDRVKQMEAIRAYTSMKGQLKEYLKEFANNKRTVCESDIKEFFDRISKRQRLTNGVPHFCR